MPLSALDLEDITLYRPLRNNSEIDLPTDFNTHTQKYTTVEIENCKSFMLSHEIPEFVCAKTNNSETHQPLRTGFHGDPLLLPINEGLVYPIYQVALDVGLWDSSPGIFKRIYPYIEWISDTINGNINKTKNTIIFPIEK